MAGVRVVTDSGADLPRELVERYAIEVVPLTVHFGDEEYRDGVDLSTDEFYRRLAAGAMPRTTQPSPAAFAEVYRRLTADGHAVISVHLSSHLSGTVKSARLAAQEVGGNIEVVDSLSASMGIGLLVLEAARRAAEGEALSAIVDRLRRLRDELTVFFSPDTLDYLQRNGRIGKAQALVGSLLNIRPLLTLKEGMVYPVERVRGKEKVRARLLDHVAAAVGSRPVKAAVVHGQAPEAAAQLAEALKRRLRVDELIIAVLGPTIATHAGPGTLGVVCHGV